jgi:hypothetical protein
MFYPITINFLFMYRKYKIDNGFDVLNKVIIIKDLMTILIILLS